MKKFRIAIAALAIALLARGVSAQTSTVSGKVTNRDGAPVANAEVALVPPPSVMASMPGMRPGATDIRVRSNADGTFQFDQVPAGQFVLQVDAPGLSRSSQAITVPISQNIAISLDLLEVPGAENAAAPAAAAAGDADLQALLERIRALEQQVTEFESTTVLSEPETRVKRIEIWVDKDGNQYDHEVPGSKRQVTYQRERAYRRQTINEKIEAALADAEERHVKIGVSAATILQVSSRKEGGPDSTPGRAYMLASADLLFTAGLAQHTVFFADVVGLSGSPPDSEIPTATLLNSYTARLVRQNELDLREAWVRTELFSQRLGIVAGRIDLTNYFDHNAVANDETSQFISDGLVNNPVLGLAVNGAGALAQYDPKNGVNFKVGIQQSSPDATNLSESLYTLAEVGYLARPPALGEGNYRLWYRATNGSHPISTAYGISIDQKLTAIVGVFGRLGRGDILAPSGTETFFSQGQRFYSVGVAFQNGWVFNPLDTWGIGYAQSNDENGNTVEKLAEGYYNFRLTERLRLSFHFQHVLDTPVDAARFRYILPGVRLQASF
jgi:hypothetical protein